MDWITRRGTPFELAAVSADRLNECVETPSSPICLQAERRAWSTVRLGKCLVASRCDGNTQSVLQGAVPRNERQFWNSCQSFGCIGMVLVAIFFLVHALGITTAVGVMFSHLKLSASLIRAAVNLHVDGSAFRFEHVHDGVQLLAVQNFCLPAPVRLGHFFLPAISFATNAD